MKRTISLFLAASASIGFATTAHADLITGRVIDSQGVGVAGINIDVENLGGGGDPVLANDGTDANGFFSTTLPAGFYRVIFIPPAPPTTTHLVTYREDVIVVGTEALGNITMTEGIAISGRVVRASGTPVGGVDIDLVDSSGDNLLVPGDMTDAFGEFLVAGPKHGVELQIDTQNGPLPLLAPISIEFSAITDTDLGDIIAVPGYAVSATLVGPGGAIDNADIDVEYTLTGNELYTPSDNSNASGFVDVVLPAGTFDIEICPMFADRIAAKTLTNVVVNSTTDLGTVVLDAGVVLSGVIRDGNGVGVPNADVDLKHPVTQVKVTLCGDNADGSGAYAVVAPTGVFDVKFTPPYALPLGSQTQPSVSIAGDTVRNGVLPDCPFAHRVGGSLPGTGGLRPRLTSIGGSTRLGNPGWTVVVSNGLGGASGVLAIGLALGCSQPAVAGTYLPTGASGRMVAAGFTLSGAAGVAGAGRYSRLFALPSDPIFADLAVVAGAIVFDPGADGGRARARHLCGQLCR